MSKNRAQAVLGSTAADRLAWSESFWHRLVEFGKTLMVLALVSVAIVIGLVAIPVCAAADAVAKMLKKN